MTGSVFSVRRHLGDAPDVVVALIWLAGAVFNAAVTLRLNDPFGWIAESTPIRPYRWFFAEVVAARPALWTTLLVVGEATLGLLTLRRGRPRVIGLAGGALFSGFLFSLLTPYTAMMGPYALFLGWLTRRAAIRHSADRPESRR